MKGRVFRSSFPLSSATDVAATRHAVSWLNILVWSIKSAEVVCLSCSQHHSLALNIVRSTYIQISGVSHEKHIKVLPRTCIVIISKRSAAFCAPYFTLQPRASCVAHRQDRSLSVTVSLLLSTHCRFVMLCLQLHVGGSSFPNRI